jgi:hypothetical protein
LQCSLDTWSHDFLSLNRKVPQVLLTQSDSDEESRVEVAGLQFSAEREVGMYNNTLYAPHVNSLQVSLSMQRMENITSGRWAKP